MGDYRVRFEVFEGPLDLLLHLIRKEEVDIYAVNLTKIATEFIEYLNLMRELDLDIAGEFVVMAATLMLIKSRELLPRDQRPEGQAGEEEELEDPRWELIRQLVEYRKFKDAASRLQQLEFSAEQTFPRVPGRIEVPEDTAARRSEATIFDLLSAVNAVLQRFSRREGEAARDVFEDRWTVSEKIEDLLGRVRQSPQVRFSELFHAATNRTEVVVTFLAILELIRLHMIVAVQPEPFSDIVIETAPPAESPTPADAPAPVEGAATEGNPAGSPAPEGQVAADAAATSAPPEIPVAENPPPSVDPESPPAAGSETPQWN